MPKWSVFVIVVVLVVGYYLLTQQARERRRERVGTDFAKIPSFYANQTYTDVAGEAAIGIDDRGRRIAVARKHAQPRTRVYSFAHLVSADVLQDDAVIATIGREDPKTPVPPPAPPDPGTADALAGLYGSTRTRGTSGVMGLPEVQPKLGQLNRVGVRMRFQSGSVVDEVLLRFYRGKPVNVESVPAEKAFADARLLLGALEIAIKRAGRPPRAAAAVKTPVR